MEIAVSNLGKVEAGFGEDAVPIEDERVRKGWVPERRKNGLQGNPSRGGAKKEPRSVVFREP